MIRLARVLLGLALTAFGVENLVLGGFLPELQPAPAWLPAPLAYLTGAILIACGACLVVDRGVRRAAQVISALLALWLLAFYAPALIATPRDGGRWTAAFEVVASAGAAIRIARPDRPWLGRTAFAIALPVFGLLHFLYIDYVAFVIPAWIPAHRFWGYATGVAHIAGGVGLLLPSQVRRAALCLAAMFGTWVIILHLPRAIAAAGHRGEWSSLFVALAMCGGSLLWIDDGEPRPTQRRAGG